MLSCCYYKVYRMLLHLDIWSKTLELESVSSGSIDIWFTCLLQPKGQEKLTEDLKQIINDFVLLSDWLRSLMEFVVVQLYCHFYMLFYIFILAYQKAETSNQIDLILDL